MHRRRPKNRHLPQQGMQAAKRASDDAVDHALGKETIDEKRRALREAERQQAWASLWRRPSR